MASGAEHLKIVPVQLSLAAPSALLVATGVRRAKPFPQEAGCAFGRVRRGKLRDQRGLTCADDAEFGVFSLGEEFRENGFGIAELIGRNVCSEEFRAIYKMAVSDGETESSFLRIARNSS